MKKKTLILIVVLVSLVLYTYHYYGNQSERYISEVEIEKYIKQEDIDPIDTYELNNGNYIILYKRDSLIGYYIVSSGNNGLISSKQEYPNSVNEKISVGGSASGYIFTTIYFNDELLLQNAKKLSLVYSDGTTSVQMINNKRGLIVPYPKHSNKTIFWREISVLDENNKVIFYKRA